jgi:hypothetical protein
MNPYAPPAQHQPLGTPPAGPASGPGTGLLILGIVEIIFGALGLLTAPLLMLTRTLARDPVSRQVQALTWEGPLGVWTRISLALGFVMALALIAAGFGIIKLKPWARPLSMAYAAAALVFTIIGQVMSAMYLYPVLFELVSQGTRNPVAYAAGIGGIAGGIGGGVFALVFPTVILVVMTRRSVKEKFRAV